MRVAVILSFVAILSACASQEPAPQAQPTAAAAPAAKKAPQCWSGDHSRFFDVDEKTSIAGVPVTCKPTSDGKAAQWMGSKH